MALTAKEVAALKARDKPYKVTDSQRLFLLVMPNGSKYWRWSYREDGKDKTLALGTFPEVSLADARLARAEAQTALHEGRDPKRAVTKSEAPEVDESLRFAPIARRWHALNEAGWKFKHAAQVISSLEAFVIPKIGDRDVRTLKRKDLVEVVTAIADRPETAHRVAQRIGAVLDYAVDTGVLDAHPGSNLVRVLPAKPAVKHHRCIPREELPRLLAKIDAYDNDNEGEIVTRLALQLLSLTFVRTSELIGARWDEFDLEAKVWLIPADRMKLPVPHVVPLSRQALAVLDDLRQLNGKKPVVFAGPRTPRTPISNNTMLFALYRMGYRGRMTGHGFRALASTLLNESGLWNRDAVERQLAHKEKDEIRAAYNRAEFFEERVRMMQWWADLLDQQRALVTPP